MIEKNFFLEDDSVYIITILISVSNLLSIIRFFPIYTLFYFYLFPN